MSGNEFKTPIPFTLPLFARTATQNENQQRSQGLPCHAVSSPSSGIVGVHFDVTNLPYTFTGVTMPAHMSQWLRVPIEEGDLGAACAYDAYLGGSSGLGGGTADLTRRGNLTSLAFQPLGNAGWSSVDPHAVVAGGTNGCVLRDSGGNNSLTLTASGGVTVTITQGAVTIVVPSGQVVTVSNPGGAGSAKFVKLADGSNSTTLKAQ